jgi:DNA (cytosine-5)-methyltransferase 1
VKLKKIELFAGIGGFRLANDWVGGIQTIVSIEINPFCQKVLKKNFPNTPIYDDVTTYSPTSCYESRDDLINQAILLLP